MALRRKALPFMVIMAALLVAISCATDSVTPTPNYHPSEVIKEKLQEVTKAFGRDLPIPTYLPQGYAMSEAQFVQPQYSYDHVELTFTSPNAPDISMSVTWFHGTFHLKPTSDRYKYIDINDGIGTYGSVVLNYHDDHNTLWWDWTPVTLSRDEPRPLEYYEMVLSASKEVPDEELVNIARFIRAAVVQHAGIVVSPSAKTPWPEVPVYIYPNEISKIKVGDEISMGLDVSPRLGQYWTANYTKDYLSLEESQIVYLDPDSVFYGTDWFRFKAVKEGNAFITYDLVTISKVTIMRFTFAFFIIDTE